MTRMGMLLVNVHTYCLQSRRCIAPHIGNEEQEHFLGLQ